MVFKNRKKNDILYKLIINWVNDNYWEQIGNLNTNKVFFNNFKNLYISMVQYNPKDRPNIN